MNSKLLSKTILVSAVLAIGANPCWAQSKTEGTASGGASETAKPPAQSTEITGRTILHEDAAPEAPITLGDLRDVGLCLMQIKQQAINIYLEVTRKPVPTTADPEIDDPNQITASGLASEVKYLPTRPEWLTFYVGTMEPIIHLFKQDISDAESGVEKIIVPKGTKEKFSKLFDEYETGVNELNKHLSSIYESIGEKDNNVKIAKEAVKIFDVADDLEKARLDAFRLIQQASGSETELVIPTKKE